MTTEAQAPESETSRNRDEPELPVTTGNWPHKAALMAATISLYPVFRRGDLADLRRMAPENPGPPAYWRLMANHHLLEYSEEVEEKWARIIQGIALMTPNSSTQEHPKSAHNPRMPLGRALYLGGEERREIPFYHEQRLNRLLQASGPTLKANLNTLFRTLSQHSIAFNWRDMARLILAEDYDPDASQRVRRRIARDYYQAEYNSKRPASKRE